MSEEQVEEEAIRLLEMHGYLIIRASELKDMVLDIMNLRFLATDEIKEMQSYKRYAEAIQWLVAICNREEVVFKEEEDGE